MASTPNRNEDKKGSWPKVSLSRSEEFLTRISTELTDEALFIAHCCMNPVPIKEKQTKDQATQISRHGLTETVFKPRHTSCCPLMKREFCSTA
uniref:Uncharacterized protein n=1 Tax=Castor canadensis TaxID=51338 RepID=A0A8C0XJA2_CASCN